jgi:hypothetical protein
VTVGVRGGIPAASSLTLYTNLTTNSIGATNVTAIINTALANCPSNSFVLLTGPGVFNCTSGISLDKSGVELRCTNGAVVVGHAMIGRAYSAQTGTNFLVLSGGGKGTTNATLSDWQDEFGGTIMAGTMLEISDQPSTTNGNFQVLSTSGYNQILHQYVVVGSRSGADITFWPPLAMDYTNSPQVFPMHSLQGAGFLPRTRMGFRDVVLTQTYGDVQDASQHALDMYVAVDSYVTGCTITNGLYNYLVDQAATVHCEVTGNLIYKVPGGASHSCMELSRSSAFLVANNAICDAGQIGLQIWSFASYGAIVNNYFTNNFGQDMDIHDIHAHMILVEGNITTGTGFEADGYFGSASHITLFRNRLNATTPIKRFSTYFNFVGNVAGGTDYNFSWDREESDYATEPYPVWQLGYPNIGNNGYNATSPPALWNDPGMFIGAVSGMPTPNGMFTVTNAPAIATNVLRIPEHGYGTFTNIPGINLSSYPLKFRNGDNHHLFYPDANPRMISGFPATNTIIPASGGTATELELSAFVFTTNGQTLFVGGSGAYQQLQQTNKSTHLWHGNYVYTNGAGQPGTLTWDAGIADHVLPDSLLYSEEPSYFGTNRYPSIDPENSVLPTAPNMAFARYYGIQQGEPQEGGGDPASTGTRTITQRGSVRINGSVRTR